MIFLDDYLILEDSLDNLHLFTLYKDVLAKYSFKVEENTVDENIIAEDILKEYDIEIDNEDNIYIIYQDKAGHLKLILLKEEREIILTEKPMPEIYNLNLKIIGKDVHLFYCVLLPDKNKQYRIIHHYYNGKTWMTNIVQDIGINQVLNPMNILEYKKELILIYYDNKKNEEIYFIKYNLMEGKWEETIKLTNSEVPKLYLDSIFVENKLHIVYCQYDENLAVKYERYNYHKKILNREIEEELSNWENINWPTIIYFEDKLWTIWAEYDNIISRYSLDNGTNWSPIYLWNDYKALDIIRYKYKGGNQKEKILNHSFGTINPIGLIGFGFLDNIIEIPLKKKIKIDF